MTNLFVHNEVEFVKNEFTNGFDIGYEGPEHVLSSAKNIPLKIRSNTGLWNKVVKEVKQERVAGPFDSIPSIPFDDYIQ